MIKWSVHIIGSQSGVPGFLGFHKFTGESGPCGISNGIRNASSLCSCWTPFSFIATPAVISCDQSLDWQLHLCVINKDWESDETDLRNCIMVTDVAARLPSHVFFETCLRFRRRQLSEHVILGGRGWLGKEVGGHGFAVVEARSPWRGWISRLPPDSEASLWGGLGASRDSRQPL